MMAPLRNELGKANPFDLLEQEAYLNLVRTAACLSGPFTHTFKKHGLSESTYNVLRILRGAHALSKHANQDPGRTCGEIGRDMVVRVPDVTRLIDRLETAGLAVRTRSEADRRVVKVEITKAGLDLLAKIDQPLLDLHKATLGHLTPSELEMLSGLLEKARQSCPKCDQSRPKCEEPSPPARG